MPAMYRKPEPMEVPEVWEGHEFISAIVADEDVAAMEKAGWVKHPAVLVVKKKAKKNELDEKADH